MRTMKIILMLVLIAFIAPSTFAKKKKEATDWSKVDFAKAYKMKVKIPGPAKKSLKSNSIFISDYTINNALKMKGSESNAKGSVFSEVVFGGIPQNKFQAMVEELYQHFQHELVNAGLTLTNGDETLASDYAQKKKDAKGSIVGKTGPDPLTYKGALVDGGILPGFGVFGVREAIAFRPVDKNIYTTTNKVYGNFYQKLSSQNEINLISIGYNLTFASFDGSRGYSSARLETNAVLSINPYIMIVNPKGAFAFITLGKTPIWGSSDWSLGLKETDLNKLEYFGLATSAKYAIEADPDKYIAEVKDIIMNYQVALVKALKENL